mgnify:CR=1 FL=1
MMDHRWFCCGPHRWSPPRSIAFRRALPPLPPLFRPDRFQHLLHRQVPRPGPPSPPRLPVEMWPGQLPDHLLHLKLHRRPSRCGHSLVDQHWPTVRALPWRPPANESPRGGTSGPTTSPTASAHDDHHHGFLPLDRPGDDGPTGGLRGNLAWKFIKTA